MPLNVWLGCEMVGKFTTASLHRLLRGPPDLVFTINRHLIANRLARLDFAMVIFKKH